MLIGTSNNVMDSLLNSFISIRKHTNYFNGFLVQFTGFVFHFGAPSNSGLAGAHGGTPPEDSNAVGTARQSFLLKSFVLVRTSIILNVPTPLEC